MLAVSTEPVCGLLELRSGLQPASGELGAGAAGSRLVSCPQAVGPGGVHSGPVQIVNNKFLAWSGVMEWQEVSCGGCVGWWSSSALP